MRVVNQSQYEEIRIKETRKFAYPAVNGACISHANELGVLVKWDAIDDCFDKAYRDALMSFDEDNGGES